MAHKNGGLATVIGVTTAPTPQALAAFTTAQWLLQQQSRSVTQVGLSLPSIFVVTGSNVNNSGIVSLSATLTPQAHNLVFCGPAASALGVPCFRSLVSADIPPINLASAASGGVVGNLPVTNLNSGAAATATTFWRGDGVWAAPTTEGYVVGPGTSVTNTLATWNGTSGTALNSLATVNNAVLVTSASGVASIAAPGGSLVVSSSVLSLVGDSSSPGNDYFYGTNNSGTKGFYALASYGVTSISGTANQVTASASVGAITLSLPTTLVSINSVTSVAASSLVLATGTSGPAVIFDSATGVPTFAAGADFGGALSGITTLATSYGSITSTGLNSCAIGATTPTTGAFTNVSASGVLTDTQTIAATSTDGLVLANPTAATGGTPGQWSPRLHFKGAGFVNFGGASQVCEFIAEAQVQGGFGAPVANLVISSQINGGGWTPGVSISSIGSITLPSGASFSFGSATGLAYVNSGTVGALGITATTNALASLNSVTSVATNNLVLATGTFGTALTFASATGAATLAATTTSTSTTTGALVIGGGVGVAGVLNVGGTGVGGTAIATVGTIVGGGLYANGYQSVGTSYSIGIVSATTVPSSTTGSVMCFYANGTLSAISSVTNTYGLFVNDYTFSGGSSTTNDYGIYISSITGGTHNYAIYTNAGSVYFGGAVQMHNYGAGTATFDSSGNITSSSDLRHKTNVQDFTTGLSELRKFQPRKWNWNIDSGLNQEDKNAGFVAQEIKDYIPEAVPYSSSSDRYTFHLTPVVAAHHNAILELDAQVTQLKKENADLRAQVAMLLPRYTQ
jgi:hypothetical protein